MACVCKDLCERCTEIVDHYLEASDWKDIALIKLCALAVGVVIGVTVPKRYKTLSMVLGFVVILVTMIPICMKFLPMALDDLDGLDI